MIWGITLVFLSIIAVPSLLLSRKPDAKELLEKIEPYQGWIGFAFCLWGIWGVISAILNLGWLSTNPIWWSTFLIGNAVEAILGFMLGFGLLNKHIFSKNEASKEKAAQLRSKLATKQGKLGVIGLVVGVWMIVASFLFL